jgi:tRNA pseudouridine55 synthase
MERIDLTNRSGWFVIDKPACMSSFDVIRELKRCAKFTKIGHTGTLDPFATGVLLVGIGKATRLMDLVSYGSKSYVFEITFGSETDTYDIEGKIVKQNDKRPTKEQLIDSMNSFLGKIDQVPPKYSAVKIHGERAYDLARGGKDFEIAAKQVTLHAIKLLEHSEDRASFEIECSKGFYVRSLAIDICKSCDVFGHVSKLKRTKNAKYTLADAISLSIIKEMMHNADTDSKESYLLPISAALDDILVRYEVTDEEARKVANGVQLYCEEQNSQNVLVFCNNSLLAIANIINNKLIPTKVLI